MDARPQSQIEPSSSRRRLAAALGWAAAGLLLLSLTLPYWQVRLFAPQYREGLTATMYAYKVVGDVEEIDSLNHYVGVVKLGSLARVERAIALPGVLLLAALAGLAFRGGPGRWSAMMAAAVASFPVVFTADMKFWMSYASTHLNATAPLKLKPFTMPLIGTGKVGQFHSEAWPQWGFLCASAAAISILVALWLSRRREASAVSSGVRPSAVLAAAMVVGFASGGARAASLQALVDAAAPGTILELPAGRYDGAVIGKTLTVRGGGLAVIDAGGKGTVVKITAPGVTLEGLVIRGSGESLLFEDSGVRVQAASATVRDCRIEDVLFGVFIDHAPGAVIEDSTIQGKPLDLGRRGDLLRSWNSDRVTLRRNRLSQGRDMVLWFSTGSVIEGNTVTGGRYGLHFMYTNGARVTGNVFADNSVGFYVMYSRGLLIEGNRFERHRGPSGAGLGLKESGSVVVRNNLFDGNRQGVYIDQSPLTPEDENLFERNLLSHNDIGMSILPGVKGNVMTDNSFVDNIQQVSQRGGGMLSGNEWSRGGRGNYWSDYAGYAPAGAVVGVVPYRVEGILEHLLERNPAARWFLFTPAVTMLELASRAFPIFRPKPILVDENPLLAAVTPSFPIEGPKRAEAPLAAAVSLFALSGLTAWAASRRGSARVRAASPPVGAAVSARGVGKSFGARRILDGVSFDLEPGGALVLWGANGAGKSTFIKCLLGLHAHDGTISMFGKDAATDGAGARERVGYVPQHTAGYDWSVAEAMDFICRVRGVDSARIPVELARVGLAGETAKALPDLSGGMRQKLALAQALIAEPDLLVLDEACANLDLASRREFLGVLRGLKGSRALLMTSHRLEEVEMIADRVLWLEEGKPARLLDVLDFLAEADGDRPLWLQLERAEAAASAVIVLDAKGFSASPNGRGIWAKVPAGRTMEAVRALEESGIAVRDLRRGGWS